MGKVHLGKWTFMGNIIKPHPKNPKRYSETAKLVIWVKELAQVLL